MQQQPTPEAARPPSRSTSRPNSRQGERMAKTDLGQELMSLAGSLTEEQVAEFKECFSLFDRDGDGTVDTAELGTVMKSLGQRMSEAELAQMISEVDVDGSGTVDFAEFLGLMARQMKDHESDKALHSAFAIFDSDGTGRIKVAHVRYVLINLCDQMSVGDVDGLLDEVTSSYDGFIDFNQFMRIFEQIQAARPSTPARAAFQA